MVPPSTRLFGVPFPTRKVKRPVPIKFLRLPLALCVAVTLASLPIAGIDGTLRRSRAGLGQSAGRAHLKTGSLQGVLALAGYVHGDDGQRQVLVALVNHPNAAAARPALDALVQWAARGR